MLPKVCRRNPPLAMVFVWVTFTLGPLLAFELVLPRAINFQLRPPVDRVNPHPHGSDKNYRQEYLQTSSM
ncbi:hypothetical protein HAX54_009176 [Datura stramonium]|uniref:Secreted protein n=1 Tax=Datura stramonium TaxID=4076 RepID=A0ABS8THA1_DATST|nr:hypothetical protein [Datura stramonium]